MRQTLVRLLAEDYSDSLEAVGAAGLPVELVWGGQDSEVPPAVAEAIRERVPQAMLTVVNQSGHLIDQALADALRSAVLKLGPDQVEASEAR